MVFCRQTYRRPPRGGYYRTRIEVAKRHPLDEKYPRAEYFLVSQIDNATSDEGICQLLHILQYLGTL